MNKVIVRIKGGIGNQLFCYAAAKRLALFRKAELIIDNRTGFIRDYEYKREYQLDHFNISDRIATPKECMMPFERYRRYILKRISARKPFDSRKYIEQENYDFDKRLLEIKTNRTIYLDGYWQSELYFTDIEKTIRKELEFIPPTDRINQDFAAQIKTTNAICLHIRWFDPPETKKTTDISNNIDKNYYNKAVELICAQTINPHFFVFSDYPEETKRFLSVDLNKTTFISHNKGDENAYADLWLMSLCKHFVIANSTFSWWGAWLSNNRSKVVIAPACKINGISAWGFKGLLPETWIKL